VFGDETGLTKKLAALNPDVVLVDLANPRRDILEELTIASRPTERPVAMFVDESTDTAMKAAIEAGVSAYVVDGLNARKIKPILDAAITASQRPQRRRRLCPIAKDRDGSGAEGDRCGHCPRHRFGPAAMNTMQINCGFIPLVDCVPLVIAKEIGFAREEGISLALHKEPNWSSLRDKLVFGQFDAAHMLSPVPVATSMGLGGIPKRLDVLSVLSINGNVIGVTSELNKKLIDLGAPSDFKSATDIGKCLIAAQSEPLRIGVPFPFSMHAELLYHWLGSPLAK